MRYGTGDVLLSGYDTCEMVDAICVSECDAAGPSYYMKSGIWRRKKEKRLFFIVSYPCSVPVVSLVACRNHRRDVQNYNLLRRVVLATGQSASHHAGGCHRFRIRHCLCNC